MKTPPTTWRVHAAGAAVCLALTAGGYYGIVAPAMSERTEAAARQAEVEAEREKATRLAGTLATLREQHAGVKKQVGDHTLVLLPATGINQRLAEVGELASACGLSTRAMQPETPTSDTRFETVPIRWSGSGGFFACAEFLRRVHEDYPDTGVSTLALSADPTVPSAPAAFEVTLVWHAAPTAAVAAGKSNTKAAVSNRPAPATDSGGAP
jgi:hypothetical protein